MRSLLRLILLVLLAAGFAAPALASIGAAPAAAAVEAPPCPSKRVVLKQCVAASPDQGTSPRGGASSDMPCPMKGIEARAADPAPSGASGRLAFEIRSVRWTGWTPPGIDPPPRS